MIVAGVDVGSLTGKAVIMENESILSYSIVPSTPLCEKTATNAMNQALEKAGLSLNDIEYIIGTGYGRLKIPFAKENVTEISCHGKGAHWLNPATRTIIDIGGQDTKVIRINEKGKVIDFAMNDKCAAGTGRFLEIMAKALEVKLEDLGPLSLKSTNPVTISSQCSVFAESEVISLLAEGESIINIIAGLHESISSRLIALVHKVGLQKEAVLSGGVAKNIGVTQCLNNKLGVELILLPADPQIIGAIGAAIFAKTKLQTSKN